LPTKPLSRLYPTPSLRYTLFASRYWLSDCSAL